MKKIALRIGVDLQNDFANATKGALGTKEAMAIIPNVKRKLTESANRGDVIWLTRDTHNKNYLQTQEGKYLPVEHCIEGTWGWEIVEGVYPEDYDVRIINKPTFGSLQLADLVYQLIQDLATKGYEVVEVELMGLCTDICVISNALIFKAKFPELTITVDATCCAGVTVESHNAALLTMKMCQVNVINWEA